MSETERDSDLREGGGESAPTPPAPENPFKPEEAAPAPQEAGSGVFGGGSPVAPEEAPSGASGGPTEPVHEHTFEETHRSIIGSREYVHSTCSECGESQAVRQING